MNETDFDKWWDTPTNGWYLGRMATDDERQYAQAAWQAAWSQQQARIDALMLEYCPDEMTPEQIEEWGRHQKPGEKE